MGVFVEIKRNGTSLTVTDIAKIKDLNYGVFDGNYKLQFDEIGNNTILYDNECIGRGIEIILKDHLICMNLPLPSTCTEIELFYQLIDILCKKMDVDVFVRDGEIISIKDFDICIENDVNASIDGIKNIDQTIRLEENHSTILFGALHPIEIGLKEVDEIDCSLILFEKLLHRLQKLDAYYAVPRYYQRKDESVFGMYFIGENITSIVPNDPKSPFFNIEKLDSHYVRLPYLNDIPYEDFINHLDSFEYFDKNHILIKLNETKINELIQNYAVDITTKEKTKGTYFGKIVDNGYQHINKIRNMDLNTEELSGLNHLAVFLRFMGEHNLLSDKLIQELPNIQQIISDKNIDLRNVILKEIVFDGKLSISHFNVLGKDFVNKFYVFNDDNGFPSCVDKVAEEYFGTEKYNCEEFQNEAYLFVPYDEDYYAKLSKYIEESFNEYISKLK